MRTRTHGNTKPNRRVNVSVLADAEIKENCHWLTQHGQVSGLAQAHDFFRCGLVERMNGNVDCVLLECRKTCGL